MDSSFVSGWLGTETGASSSVDEKPRRRNVATCWQWRELGFNPKGSVSNSRMLQEAAEDNLVNKVDLNERGCELPGVPKSTFLMVFSPDGTKVASTHGNHKIYVSELSSGKHVKTLSGHPRTPWCVAFHPSHSHLLGSGCLGGQVRVWDLSGGSEVWTVSNKTVIASLAFHPRDRLLVVATYNDLYFWDWAHPQPFTKVQTNTIREKVRFVAFDALGHKLITGISVWNCSSSANSVQQPTSHSGIGSPLHPVHGPAGSTPHDHIPTYNQLLQRYDNLVRNYRHLFLARSQLNTTDRGTDPMELDPGPNLPSTSTSNTNTNRNPEESAQGSATTSSTPIDVNINHNHSDSDDNSESAGRSLNLDVQSISLGNNTPVSRQSSVSRTDAPTTGTMTFVTTSVPRVSYMAMPRERFFGSGAHQSAFRPLSDTINSSRSDNPESSEADPRRREGAPPTDRLPYPFSFPTDAAPSPSISSDTTSLRNELTASLNRLQGFMENSIDETLNIIERHDSARTSPIYSSLNSLRQFSLLRHSGNSSIRRLNVTPPTNTFVRNPQINSNGTRQGTNLYTVSPHVNNSHHFVNRTEENATSRNPDPPTPNSTNQEEPQISNNRENATSVQENQQNTPNEGNLEQQLNTIGNIMRASRHRLLNLISEFTEFNTRHMRQFQQLSGRQAGPFTTENIRDRTRPQSPPASRNDPLSRIPYPDLLSSDDGSDSDRELFSPLPLHIYRTRNWNAPRSSNNSTPPRLLGNFGLNLIFEPTSTSSISTHIDHEYVANSTPDNTESVRLDSTQPQDHRSRPLERNLHELMTRNTSNPSTSRLLNTDSQSSVNNSENLNQMDIDAPSTSRQASQQQMNRVRTSSAPEQSPGESQGNDSFVKVTRGVQAIERHTEALVNLCSTNASQPPLRQLRRMWEDLRREIIIIQRQSANGQGPPRLFSLSAHERCNLLNYMSTSLTERNRSLLLNNKTPNANSSANRSRNTSQPPEASRSTDNVNENNGNPSNDSTSSQEVSDAATNNSSSSNIDLPSTSSGIGSDTPSSRNRRTYPPSSRYQYKLRFSNRDPSTRRRLRSIILNRLSRYRNMRNRSPYRQELEITRDNIRWNARRVLAIMFNIMMHCLEAEQLGNQIIVMLRSLKKALGLTCLLLMSQPFPNESHRSEVANSQGTSSDSQSQSTAMPSTSADNSTNLSSPTPPQTTENSSEGVTPISVDDRIAVQISAVNQNNSSNAKKRSENYYSFKRAQALRNRNPFSRTHSLKRESSASFIPPAKIPATSKTVPKFASQPNTVDDPVPSTSGLQRSTENSNPRISESNSQNTTTTSSASSRTSRYPESLYSGMSRRVFLEYFFMGGVVSVYRRLENQRDRQSSNGDTPTTQPANSPRPFSVRGNTSVANESIPHSGTTDSIINNVVVPVVRVNDVPVPDVQLEVPFPQLQLHTREPPIIPQNIMSAVENGGAAFLDSGSSLVIETLESPMHRIQVWDFTQGQLPDISNATMNVVVEKCKIHNDASIDISRDGQLLVALLPARLRNITHRLSIYSLDWNCLGDCLYSALLEQNAVSVSLSPCARHLAVGLGSRRVSLQPYGRNTIMALIFRLEGHKKLGSSTRRGCLIPVRSLQQSWDLGFTSLNCLRWAPQPGQGLVYANNTGHLKILS